MAAQSSLAGVYLSGPHLKGRRANVVWLRVISFAKSAKKFMAQTDGVILPVNINVVSMVSFVGIAFLSVVDSFHVPVVIAENVMLKFSFTSLTASVTDGSKPDRVCERR